MDKETSRIKSYIDSEREQLGRDLDEIEYRVKHATDIRAHFDKNTAVILGAAVAGGFLLAVAFRKSPPSSGVSAEFERRDVNTLPVRSRSPHVQHVSETLDNIFEGLVAVVSDKLSSFVADAVPGFRAHYDAIERQRGRSSVYQMKPNYRAEGDLSAK